jgi:hypothetical protein
MDAGSAEILSRLSQVSLSLGDEAGALGRAREAIALAQQAADLEEQGRAQLALAAALRRSDPDGAREALRAGLSRLHAMESPDCALLARSDEVERALGGR